MVHVLIFMTIVYFSLTQSQTIICLFIHAFTPTFVRPPIHRLSIDLIIQSFIYFTFFIEHLPYPSPFNTCWMLHVSKFVSHDATSSTGREPRENKLYQQCSEMWRALGWGGGPGDWRSWQWSNMHTRMINCSKWLVGGLNQWEESGKLIAI